MKKSFIISGPVSIVCDQVRLEPVSSDTETSYSLEHFDIAGIAIILPG